MNIFRRRRPDPPMAAKSAEFTDDVIMSVRMMAGGWYYGDYGMMYRRQPAVRATVDFIARNIAQLNAKTYDRISATDRIEVDHPLAQLLRRPNPVTTRYAHMRDTVADLAIYDVAYWWKLRDGRDLRAVARIPPSSMCRDSSDPDRVVYRLSDGRVIPRSDLCVFKGYSPDGTSDGVSSLETLRRVLQEEAAGLQHRENMWRNSARQSGFIQRPLESPDWSDTARERFRVDMEATLAGGSNAGRIGILEEGMTWNAASFSPEQTDYIAGRRLTYEEVAIVYGLDPSIIGMGNETKANAEEYHRQVYQDLLGPWLRMLQDEFELQLLPEWDPLRRSSVYVEFNIAEKLKGSFEEQAKTLASTVGVPTVSVNEGRAKLNLPRIDEEWADVPVRPLNVMYGGQPATTVPTAVPGDPQEPGVPAVAAATRFALKAGPPPPPPAAALARRDEATRQHEELFRKFFERQQRAVVSAKGLKADRSRWDRELTADLYLLATTVTRKNGEIAARQLRGVYKPEQTFPYLAENARIAAERINAETFDQIDEATTGEEVRHVFEIALGARLAQVSLGRATTLVNFARNEAATQSQAADGKRRTKTWVVTSRKSRHPELGGETVDCGEEFSNGMAWPGDSHGSAGEVAGCQCLLRLSD